MTVPIEYREQKACNFRSYLIPAGRVLILLPLTMVVAVMGFRRCRATAITPGGAMLGLTVPGR